LSDEKKKAIRIADVLAAVKAFALAVFIWFSDPLKRYATILGACLLISAVAFGIFAIGHTERVFFFPEIGGKGIGSETRTLIRRPGMENQLEYYVREMVLGPMNLTHDPLVPPDTGVNAILVRKGTAYIDLSSSFLVSEGTKLPFPEIFSYIERSVSFNFPSIRNVVLTLDGNLPNVP
jgi:hypothetical protein